MIIPKGFRYRLCPAAEQQQALAVQFGHTRFVWNWALALRKAAYKETSKGIGYYELKCRADMEWLRDAYSQVLQSKIEA